MENAPDGAAVGLPVPEGPVAGGVQAWPCIGVGQPKEALAVVEGLEEVGSPQGFYDG